MLRIDLFVCLQTKQSKRHCGELLQGVKVLLGDTKPFQYNENIRGHVNVGFFGHPRGYREALFVARHDKSIESTVYNYVQWTLDIPGRALQNKTYTRIRFSAVLCTLSATV